MALLESFFGGFIKEKRSINSDECFEAVRWSLHKPLTRHPKKKTPQRKPQQAFSPSQFQCVIGKASKPL